LGKLQKLFFLKLQNAAIVNNEREAEERSDGVTNVWNSAGRVKERDSDQE
jgi:hypothetical protein